MFRPLAAANKRDRSGRHAPDLRIYTLVALLPFITMLTGCTPSTPNNFEVIDAQVRALLPGRDTTAGYFTLTNNKDVSITLTGARSDLTRAIEMHETFEIEGRMRMRPLDPIVIPAGGQVRFQPGGKHLMLFGTQQVPEQFPITLIFDSGEELSVTFGKLSL